MTFYSLVSKLLPKLCREIPHPNGGVLLQQIKVWDRKGTVAYLQHFCQPEEKDVFHRHRWDYMRSIVLTGHYVEERPNFHYVGLPQKEFIKRHWFKTHTMDAKVIHRISHWSPRCWTLFITKNNKHTWGYYNRDGVFTPWDEYIPEARRVKSL